MPASCLFADFLLITEKSVPIIVNLRKVLIRNRICMRKWPMDVLIIPDVQYYTGYPPSSETDFDIRLDIGYNIKIGQISGHL